MNLTFIYGTLKQLKWYSKYKAICCKARRVPYRVTENWTIVYNCRYLNGCSNDIVPKSDEYRCSKFILGGGNLKNTIYYVHLRVSRRGKLDKCTMYF